MKNTISLLDFSTCSLFIENNISVYDVTDFLTLIQKGRGKASESYHREGRKDIQYYSMET
jgi:hypothetical protein